MAHPPYPDRRRPGFFSHFLPAAKVRNKKRPKKRRIWEPGGSEAPRSWSRLLVYGAALLTAAVLVVVVIVLMTGTGRDDVNPAHKILELTAQDIDPETTALAKNLLKTGQIDPRLATTLWRDARRQLSGSPLKEVQNALVEGRVNETMEPLIKQLAADFGTGKAVAFTIWVVEDESQKGNAVDLQLEGVPLGRFSIEQGRYAITIVERKGQSLRLQISGASGANRGAVFRAETATSTAETRHLGPGKNDYWQLVIK